MARGAKEDGIHFGYRLPRWNRYGRFLSRLGLLLMVDFGRERVFRVSTSDARYRRRVKGPDFMAKLPRVKNADYPYHDPQLGLHET